MSKYFDTKPGSLEEAVSAAQQAAIAISKKERGEKPKDEGNAFGAALQAAKEKGEKTFVVGGKKYDVKTEEDKLDPVNPKAAAKKFKDRKDKDLDNDGDVDSSDKYLHKRRKAIGKAMKSESLKETVIAMWQEAAKKSESQDMLNDKDGDGMDDDQKPEKTGAKKKTDTGKPMTTIDVSPKMPKIKNEKNKV